MPITTGIEMHPIPTHDFRALDYRVMGLVFEIHRELGRFWKEQIYQQELAFRCRNAGFEQVAVEVPIRVSLDDFVKSYYIDLLVNNIIYELKTAETLTGNHQKQTINYLLLTGLRNGKLINMRTPSVETRFVSTRITPDIRYAFRIDDTHWQAFDDDSIWLKQMFTRLLDEWGVFLEINLFYKALSHFRGGDENMIKELEVRDGTRLLGTQKAHVLNADLAFKITAMTNVENRYENDLRRFMRFTSLKAIHWINFNHETVIFKTIIK